MPFDALVVADERMQVAVTGMEHVADANALALAELTDPPEDFRQLRARHDAVLHVVVGRDSPHRRERGLPPFPDPRSAALRPAQPRPASRPTSGTWPRRWRTTRRLRRDGPSSSTIRIVSAGGKFGWTAASAASIATRVHHLHRGRDDPGRDDVRDGRPGFADAVERGQQRLHALRLSQDPHDGLGHDGQRAFAADDESQDIRPRCIGQRTANLHEIPVRQDRLDGEDVMHREAVLQAVRAARVFATFPPIEHTC